MIHFVLGAIKRRAPLFASVPSPSIFDLSASALSLLRHTHSPMAVPVVEIDDVDWTEVKRPNPHFFKVLGGDFTQRMASDLFIFFPGFFLNYFVHDLLRS